MEWDFHDAFPAPELAMVWWECQVWPCQVLQGWSGWAEARAALGPDCSWVPSVIINLSCIPSVPEHHCGLKGSTDGIPFDCPEQPAVFRVTWSVTTNKENCSLERSEWAGHSAQSLGWVWNQGGWISLYFFLKIHHLYPLIFTPLITESLFEEESLLWAASPVPPISAHKSCTLWWAAHTHKVSDVPCRREAQSKSSYPWHQDTLAKTILINYNYNCMLNKLQLGCLMYQLIILGM